VKVASIGGGPAGLYFGILLKQADPSHEVIVYERNRPDDTFGFGVVFSDATLGNLSVADEQSFVAITQSFAHWDDIETHAPRRFDDPRVDGAPENDEEVVISTGHAFSGLSRQRLLAILQARAAEVGVRIVYERELAWPADGGLPDELRGADLVLAADGVNSATRTRFSERFQPSIDLRPNHFVWLGTTRPFPAFTFYFDRSEHGLFRVHAYQFRKPGSEDAQDGPGRALSTFIVECTDETWRAAGFDRASEADTLAYFERLFARRLDGHKLIPNRSIWRNFPTISNGRWWFRHEAGPHVVLLGDAAHTAHFSIGSGTKLAMEDSIALRDAVVAHADLGVALAAYEKARRPGVDTVQRAAAPSLRWFEDTERYAGKQDPLTFTFNMLTRSLRIHHANLKLRDPALVSQLDRAFAARAAAQAKVAVKPDLPPMFTPLRLRDLVISNRVAVSPMCMYSAEDGLPSEFHLVHYGSRAIGGAGLVLTEMTDVAPDARITPGCTGLWSDAHAQAWKRVVDFVHASSGAKIGVQLGHAGRKGATKKMWEGIDQPLEAGAWPLIAPSAIPYFPHSQVPREMTRADMDRVRDQFVAATRYAEQAGFDLLELHMAHGYLLASFLSPLTNQRTDEYGGAPHNRLRFPLEVFRAVRDAWPAHKPISVRLSATDWIDGGLEVDDAVDVARALKTAGCDIVDVSSAQTTPDSKPSYGRLYQTPFSDRVRNEAELPTMTVGNVSSWGDVNAILAAGRADLCLLARGHLYDPYWTRHAAQDQGVSLPWPAPYAAAASFTPRES
jgi:anthraniloyl-CoA monooxygenase